MVVGEGCLEETVECQLEIVVLKRIFYCISLARMSRVTGAGGLLEMIELAGTGDGWSDGNGKLDIMMAG